MKHSEYRRLTGGFIVAALLVCLSIVVAYRTASRFEAVTRLEIVLTQSAEKIRFLDEVLTMSARMGAFTADSAWEKRYLAAVPQLDDAIAQGMHAGELDDAPLKQVSQANDKLIELETQAFALVNANQSAQAVTVLFSPTYDDNKRHYAEGVNQFVAALQSKRQQIEQSFRSEMLKSATLMLAMLAVIAFIVVRMYRIMARRLELESALSNVAQRLISPHPANFNEEIGWVLELLANKSKADSAWLVYRHAGATPRLVKSWHHSRNAVDATTEPSIISALRFASADEHGNLVLPAAHANQAMIGDFIGVAAPYQNQHEYALCLLAQASGQLAWSAEDSKVLINIDEIIVRAMESQTHELQLQKLATTDGLTGLFNRRQFGTLFEAEWQRNQGTSLPSAMLMLDIDWFKKINDQYGHAVGDEVLIAIANTFRSQLREDDIVGRVGGEEFAIILPTSTAENALDMAERLRRVIQETPIQTAAGAIHISVSIGVTLFRKEDTSVEFIAKRADDALYVSKNEGRNRVTFR
jgi:diguanylate cyclase (GGDEF)-like protein